MKRLYRSEEGELGGVCTGIAKYYHVDSLSIQMLFLFFTFFTGILAGLMIYCACVAIIPHENDIDKEE